MIVDSITVGIIYKRTSPENKHYIGQTIREEDRNDNWFNLNQPYTSKYSRIDIAREKYSPETWSYEVLYTVISNKLEVKRLLNLVETQYIKYFRSDEEEFGYNMSSGGQGFVYESCPIVVFDLYTNKLLSRFESIIDCDLYYGKNIVFSRTLKRCRDTNQEEYYPPVGRLPDGTAVLIYKEDEWTEEMLYLDSEKAKEISIYRRVAQINKTTGDLIRIWNNSSEASKFFGITHAKDQTILTKCKQFEKNNFTTFMNCIWMFLDTYYNRISSEGKLGIVRKGINGMKHPTVGWDIVTGNCIGIFRTLEEGFKFVGGNSNVGISKSMKTFKNYKTEKIFVSYKMIWSDLPTLDEILSLGASSIKVSLLTNKQSGYNPYRSLDLNGNPIKDYINIDEILKEFPFLNTFNIQKSAREHVPVLKNYRFERIPDEENFIYLNLNSAKRLLDKFKSEYIINSGTNV